MPGKLFPKLLVILFYAVFRPDSVFSSARTTSNGFTFAIMVLLWYSPFVPYMKSSSWSYPPPLYLVVALCSDKRLSLLSSRSVCWKISPSAKLYGVMFSPLSPRLPVSNRFVLLFLSFCDDGPSPLKFYDCYSSLFWLWISPLRPELSTWFGSSFTMFFCKFKFSFGNFCFSCVMLWT